jgi:hypothetical protein
MSLRDQLQTIYDNHRTLTPGIVVDEARDPEHPLHARFEWDDSVAGEKWRHHQAHELITSVKITYKTPSGTAREIRQFHAIRKETGHVYEPTEEVLRDEVMTKILLADMEREWRTLKKRYDQFTEFRNMIHRDLGDAAA